MCCVGNLSGQTATLTNPTSQTLFSLSGGGNAYIPTEFGKVLRLIVSGAVTFDSGSTDGDTVTYEVLVGDPTNVGSAVAIQNDAITFHTGTTYHPFILNYIIYLDSTANKIYAWPADGETTTTLGGLSINQNFSGGTSQDISSLSKYNIFLTEKFSASHANNKVTLSQFQINEA